MAEPIAPPLPELGLDAPFAAAAEAARAANAPAVLLVDPPAGPRLVAAADARRAVEADLGGWWAKTVAHGRLPQPRVDRPLDCARRAVARRRLPALPLWRGDEIVASIALDPTDRARLAPRLDLGTRLAGLPEGLRDRLAFCTAAAAELGLAIYLVGGVVRDLLLGRPVTDLDLMVDGDALALARAVGRRAGLVVEEHPAFETATLRFPDGSGIDIARARRETYPRPAALPVVSPADPVTDLARRDFTVNAMAIRLAGPAAGRLFDPWWGSVDLGLERGGRLTVRALHGMSFVDDPTRIFRGARFLARFDGRLDAWTRRGISLGVQFIEGVSGERLRHELRLCLREPEPERVLAHLDAWGALDRVDVHWRFTPAIAGAFAALTALRAASPARAAAGASAPSRPAGVAEETFTLAYLGLLGLGAGVELAARLARRLTLTREESLALFEAIEARARLPVLALPELRRSELFHALSPFGPPARLALWAAAGPGRARERIERFERELADFRAPLDGRDVMRVLGLRPGPDVGAALRALLDAALDGEVGDRESAEHWLRRWHTRAAE